MAAAAPNRSVLLYVVVWLAFLVAALILMLVLAALGVSPV